MAHYYWNDWYFEWGWILWFGFIFLMFSSFGHWGYAYRTRRQYSGRPENRAFDILDERYARGEINHDQYSKLKSDIGGGGTASVIDEPGSVRSTAGPVTRPA